MPAAAKGGSPARKKPQGGSAKKKGKAKARTGGKNRSEVINEKLASGFKNQIGFDHFKTDWKKQVAEKYKKEGAWIPKKVGNEFHYIFDDKDKNPAVVTAAEAKEFEEKAKKIAEEKAACPQETSELAALAARQRARKWREGEGETLPVSGLLRCVRCTLLAPCQQPQLISSANHAPMPCRSMFAWQDADGRWGRKFSIRM